MPGAASDPTAQNRLPDAVGCSMSRPCDAGTRSGPGGIMLGTSDAFAENSEFETPCDATGGKMCEEPLGAVPVPSSNLSSAFEKALKCSPITPSLR